jgi:hypothetical protein
VRGKITPVRGVVCRGLDTTIQVGWGKKKTRQVGVYISRALWVGCVKGGGQVKKNRKEKYLITYVDKPSTKTQGQRREG